MKYVNLMDRSEKRIWTETRIDLFRDFRKKTKEKRKSKVLKHRIGTVEINGKDKFKRETENWGKRLGLD